jgi:hypothetical protein
MSMQASRYGGAPLERRVSMWKVHDEHYGLEETAQFRFWWEQGFSSEVGVGGELIGRTIVRLGVTSIEAVCRGSVWNPHFSELGV